MGNFWSYVDSFRTIQPVTTVLVVCQIAIFVYQTWRKVQPDEFAFRYDAVVEGKQYWRCVTATFSHLGIFHIVMNMVSLWLMAYMEAGLGSVAYLKYTLLLVCGTQACQIAAGWLLSRYKPSWLWLTNGAGYSGVLFGWLMLYAMQNPLGSTSVFSLNVPNLVLPFVYLFGTQLLIRRVSFIGHSSGLLFGLLIALGLFRWLDHFAGVAGCLWLAILFLASARTHSTAQLAWIGLATPAMAQSRVRDGQVVHAGRDSAGSSSSSSSRDRSRDWPTTTG